jgi:hypothetical protein
MVVNPGTLGIETSAVVISQAVALTP